MKKISISDLKGLSWQISPSGTFALTSESTERLIQLEEYFREALLPVIDETIGKDWKIEFAETVSSPATKAFEAYIFAPDVASYLLVVQILKQRLSNEYITVGRDIEFTGLDCHFSTFDRSIVHSFIQYDSFHKLPIALLYAGVMD